MQLESLRLATYPDTFSAVWLGPGGSCGCQSSGIPTFKGNALVYPPACNPAFTAMTPSKAAGQQTNGLTKQHSSKLAVTAQDVAGLRQGLSEEDSAAAADDMIQRYIRACGGDKRHALKRLQDTLAWRRQEQPKQMICRLCTKDSRSHYMHIVGFDLQQRPVIYSCLAAASDRDVQANRIHMISTFEQAIRMMPPGVEQWVWVSDFYGFGFQDCNPRLGKIFLDVSANHYPERLGTFMVVDAPRIFNGLWTMMQPLVDPVTKKKIRFAPYDFHGRHQGEGLRKILAEHFDDEMQDWLLAEMAENRDKAAVKQKVYPYNQAPTAAGAASPAASSKGHDIRGTSQLLKKLAAEPHVLLPPVPVSNGYNGVGP